MCQNIPCHRMGGWEPYTLKYLFLPRRECLKILVKLKWLAPKYCGVVKSRARKPAFSGVCAGSLPLSTKRKQIRESLGQL